MSRPWRRRAGCVIAAVLTMTLVAIVADGVAAPARANVVPAKLVGQWTRTVTTTDLKRTGATGIPAGSVWTLTVKKSGYASLRGVGQGEPFVGKIVPAGGANRVHINVGVLFPNVYKWRVSGRLLTFTKINESLPDRGAVMWGVWKQK